MGWLTCCACTANVRDGTAWGLGHFRAMFRDDLEWYICDATARVRPKLVVPTMLYYLDEDASAESRANCVLRCIGYNRNPSHVQAVIDRTYLDGVAKVCVPGSVVAPLALSAALDGRTAATRATTWRASSRALPAGRKSQRCCGGTSRHTTPATPFFPSPGVPFAELSTLTTSSPVIVVSSLANQTACGGAVLCGRDPRGRPNC